MLRLCSLDPPWYGWTACGGIASILEPHEAARRNDAKVAYLNRHRVFPPKESQAEGIKRRSNNNETDAMAIQKQKGERNVLYRCPKCDKTNLTKHGMYVHYGIKHRGEIDWSSVEEICAPTPASKPSPVNNEQTVPLQKIRIHVSTPRTTAWISSAITLAAWCRTH